MEQILAELLEMKKEIHHLNMVVSSIHDSTNRNVHEESLYYALAQSGFTHNRVITKGDSVIINSNDGVELLKVYISGKGLYQIIDDEDNVVKSTNKVDVVMGWLEGDE